MKFNLIFSIFILINTHAIVPGAKYAHISNEMIFDSCMKNHENFNSNNFLQLIKQTNCEYHQSMYKYCGCVYDIFKGSENREDEFYIKTIPNDLKEKLNRDALDFYTRNSVFNDYIKDKTLILKTQASNLGINNCIDVENASDIHPSLSSVAKDIVNPIPAISSKKNNNENKVYFLGRGLFINGSRVTDFNRDNTISEDETYHDEKQMRIICEKVTKAIKDNKKASPDLTVRYDLFKLNQDKVQIVASEKIKAIQKANFNENFNENRSELINDYMLAYITSDEFKESVSFEDRQTLQRYHCFININKIALETGKTDIAFKALKGHGNHFDYGLKSSRVNDLYSTLLKRKGSLVRFQELYNKFKDQPKHINLLKNIEGKINEILSLIDDKAKKLNPSVGDKFFSSKIQETANETGKLDLTQLFDILPELSNSLLGDSVLKILKNREERAHIDSPAKPEDSINPKIDVEAIKAEAKLVASKIETEEDIERYLSEDESVSRGVVEKLGITDSQIQDLKNQNLSVNLSTDLLDSQKENIRRSAAQSGVDDGVDQIITEKVQVVDRFNAVQNLSKNDEILSQVSPGFFEHYQQARLMQDEFSDRSKIDQKNYLDSDTEKLRLELMELQQKRSLYKEKIGLVKDQKQLEDLQNRRPVKKKKNESKNATDRKSQTLESKVPVNTNKPRPASGKGAKNSADLDFQNKDLVEEIKKPIASNSFDNPDRSYRPIQQIGSNNSVQNNTNIGARRDLYNDQTQVVDHKAVALSIFENKFLYNLDDLNDFRASKSSKDIAEKLGLTSANDVLVIEDGAYIVYSPKEVDGEIKYVKVKELSDSDVAMIKSEVDQIIIDETLGIYETLDTDIEQRIIKIQNVLDKILKEKS